MKAYVFLANGFETVEALAVVDILRRGKVDVTTVSIHDTKAVETAQKIVVCADQTLAEGISKADLLFLPGGMPGTKNLEACAPLMEAVKRQAAEGGYVGAICAAPSILGHLHLLEGKKATCYPGFEPDLLGASVSSEGVVVDGRIITGKGMGVATEMGLTLVSLLVSKECSDSIRASIQSC